MGQLSAVTLIALAAMLISCGDSKETLRQTFSGSEDKPKKAPLSYYEATLRPSDFDEEVEIVQKAHAQATGGVPIDIPADSTSVEVEVVQGFRVQLFASSSIDEATAAKMTAEEKALRDSIYVVYDPPVYKVRIGDYPTRLEANQKLARLVNLGYPDAWVVADRIVLRRILRFARPMPE